MSPSDSNKEQVLNEETRFYMFYFHPRDTRQEVAAQDLYVPFFPPHIHSLTSSLLSCCDATDRLSRNWCFKEELRL